jgi:rubrerythrin
VTTYECFQAAARIETLAQELYARLAAIFDGRPYLRHLFAQLAVEEGQHAMRIALLARHQGRSPWAAEALDRISASLGDMAREIEAMKAEFARAGSANDPVEVLRRVVEMERRFGSIHAEELSHSANPDVHELFTSLAEQDARHRAIIESAQPVAV